MEFTALLAKRRRESGGFPGYDVIMKQLKEKSNVTKRVGFISSGPPARGVCFLKYHSLALTETNPYIPICTVLTCSERVQNVNVDYLSLRFHLSWM